MVISLRSCEYVSVLCALLVRLACRCVAVSLFRFGCFCLLVFSGFVCVCAFGLLVCSVLGLSRRFLLGVALNGCNKGKSIPESACLAAV